VLVRLTSAEKSQRNHGFFDCCENSSSRSLYLRPDCVTFRIFPPTVIVAVRAVPPLLLTEYETVAGPDPEEVLNLSHDALLTAAHEQPAPAVSCTEWVAALRENESVVALSAYVQTPACVIVAELPAMFNVAMREEDEVLGATV
jgi:hypothetical protein